VGALTKIAQKGIESVSDFLKSFSEKTYYHGSASPNIEKFDPLADPQTLDYSDILLDKGSRGVSYFTSDPKYANEILAYQGLVGKYDTGATVYPVKLKMNYLFDPKNIEDLERLRQAYGPKYYDREIGYTHDYEKQILNHDDVNLESWKTLELPAVQESLKDAGFRGYLVGDESGTVGLFYPDEGDVRSVYAKFDPAQSKSGNILASVPAAAAVGLSGYGALDMLGEENGQSSN
tara:strand:+ start:149 stop:850 length:702 start_codon:yes stop_codon:yes gene_type:complete